MLEKMEGAIKNERPIYTGNIRNARHTTIIKQQRQKHNTDE